MNLWHYLGFGGNFLFSLFCAYELLINNDVYEKAFPFNPLILKAVGFGLIIFSLILLNNILKPSLKRGMEITFQDILWIILTGLVSIIFKEKITLFGIKTIMFVNAIVFLAIVLQYGSFFNLLKSTSKGFDYYFEFQKKINSSKEQFWNVLSKLDQIHNYAASVDSSKIINNNGEIGLGTTRVCTSGKKKKWSERVYDWREGESFSLDFDPNFEGFPFPVEKMRGGWKLTTITKGNFVTIWFELSSKKLGIFLPVFCYVWTISLSKAIKNMDNAA